MNPENSIVVHNTRYTITNSCILVNPENSIVDHNTRYTRTNSCILVNPENSIVDHNTRFSGISERDLNVGPTKSLKVK